MMIKPQINLGPEDTCHPLVANISLFALRDNASYHELRDCRHPLGVYGLSIVRICEKVSKCADKLEHYWTIDPHAKKLREEVVDYLELALYAAAEHVDDIERIAYTFFKTDREAQKDRNVRILHTAMKPLRDEISSFTNAIKHNHGRIRLFDTNFNHDGCVITLLGFFIEGFKDGAASPNPILHGSGKTIVSVTSFLWSILTFIAQSSEELSRFLHRIGVVNESEKRPCEAKSFIDASLKLTRLPLYTFDEEHPFSRVKWVIGMDDTMYIKVKSMIYGSILRPWSKSEDGTFNGWRLDYAGDNVTKSFKIALPRKMGIQHWE